MNDNADTRQPSYPTRFPGFGYPVNYTPEEAWYPGGTEKSSLLLYSAVNDYRMQLPMLTLQETKMLRFMNELTDVEEWFIKIKDTRTAEKWIQDAVIVSEETQSSVSMTLNMATYCIAELRQRAESIKVLDPPPTFVYNGDVYKSDHALSPAFRARLQTAATAFESKVLEDTIDGLPGSSQAVRNIVDPLLFPLLYGRTRVLPGDTLLALDDCISRCGDGVAVAIPTDLECEETNRLEPDPDNWYAGAPSPQFSKRFQCLPCEVDISTESARITSYINNLHPVHDRQLYSLMEEIQTATIPIWEWTLSPVKIRNYDHPRVEVRISYETVTYDFSPPYVGNLSQGCPPPELGEDSYVYEERASEWLNEARLVTTPDAGAFVGPPSHPLPYPLREDFKNQGLQVVVKLANIQLTPDNPAFYDEDSWRPDGMMNQHIAATSIYCYSSENVTTPSISFRHQVEADRREFEGTIGYEEGQREWLYDIFGCENEGPGVQTTGSVQVREGRLVTFTNILQHRFESFQLQDPTKEGHWKIVVLSLVDPNLKILSTAKVPCQRKDWYLDHISNLRDDRLEAERYRVGYVDFPLDLSEAKVLRQEFAREMKAHDEEQAQSADRS